MLQKIVIEEIKSEDSELMEIIVTSEGEVKDEFMFHSIMALVDGLTERLGCTREQIYNSLLNIVVGNDESKESGEPINEVKRSID